MTILFLALWLQMSAQPRSAWQNCITVNNMPCARAADETDVKIKALPMCDRNNCQPNPPDPEPVDVPAVQETEDTSDTWWTVPSTGPADVQVKGVQRRWTCTDKSRVLLTSEDGKKHCIKF